VYAVAHQAARMPSHKVLEAVDRGMILSLGLATAVCGWQLAANYLGFYFPSDFFLSNAGYAQTQGERANEQFFGYLRLNGPFLEPSALAYFFGGFLFYVWKRDRIRSTFWSVGLIGSTLACIFLAYSTTGYAILAVFIALATLDLLANLLRRQWTVPRSGYYRLAIAALMLVAATGSVILVAEHWSGLERIFREAITEKAETESFQSRTGADLMAVRVLAQTWGLGLGLGSHKPNSLLLTLLSNLGIVGTAAFAIFLWNILRRCPSEHAVAVNGHLMTSAPLRFFIVGLLAAHSVSNPNLNEVVLWVGFGFMVGYLASREYELGTLGTVISSAWGTPAQPQSLDREGSAGRQT
jgi:hypothetical protein